jgi:myo-inositol-1(or 4)-monophosphatase
MSSPSPERILRTVIDAARAGGELARARLGHPGYMRWKGPRDLQAGAVLDIQARIVQVIRAEFADDPILVEETEEPQDSQADPLWIVDPIDGSLNFNQSVPLFGVSVAYRSAGRYEAGAVYDPCNAELFHAAFGRGAYLNGQPITVDKLSEGEDAYKRALVGTDLPGSDEQRKIALYVNRSLGNEVTQLWMFGAPALGMCYVAAGRMHAYYCLALQLWDVAAASVILREAGGTFTDIEGGPSLFSGGGYLASNGVIHGGMLRGIKPAMDIYKFQQSRGPSS